ncbi:hypothetical protein G7054_g3169 [Neopestalotiopsis clavispora]|nr:hypothetical protein G7054_g3169 [Neopestalotiopsis clavispora]
MAVKETANEKNNADVGDGEILQTRTSTVDLEADKIFQELTFSHADLEAAREQAQALTLEEATSILENFLEQHGEEMTIPLGMVTTVRSIVEKLLVAKGADEYLEQIARTTAAVLNGNSVYREVRASVDPDDDANIPVNTIRAWMIGIIWASGLAAINQFFAPRQPAITVTVYLAQLFGFLMGKFCATTLPTRIWFRGSKFEFTLNPGPWSLKEQTVVTMMANVSYATPLITYLFFMQRLPVYLGQEWAASYGYGFCMLLAAQLMGYGLAGITRRFLIYPANMIWYFVLSQMSMNRAFIENINIPANGWKASKFKFFWIAFGIAFCYYWFPGTIFPTMTFFNWITWIKPASATVAIITGTYYFNMGYNPIPTLDYQWLATLDPFVTPWFVLVQIIVAVGLWGLLVTIPVFFSNTWYTAYLPINSWYPYDNTGQIYSTSLILGTDNRLNVTAYEAYSPVFLPASPGLRYAGMMAMLPALLTGTFLYYRKMLLPIFKNLFKRGAKSEWTSDIHSRLMRDNYTDVPDWVYLVISLLAMCLGWIAIYVWPTNLPGWIFPFAFFSSAVFIIPIGILCAITGYQTDLEILFNIIGGAVANGDPIFSFVFKTLGKCLIQQSIFFTSDMKLAHYAKIPPRVTLACQVVGTFFACIVTLGVVNWQITSIDGICDASVQQRWICSGVSTNWTSAIVWGALGPRRLFAHTSMYRFIPFALLAGAIWPIPWYFATKKWPNSYLRYCHPLVMLIAPVLWAPLNFSNLWGALPISFVAGYYVKTRYVDWWNKYNYVLSTALISGIAISLIIQTLAITNQGLAFPDWWGTTQYYQTCDLQDCRYLTLAEGETFGPTEWH